MWRDWQLEWNCSSSGGSGRNSIRLIGTERTFSRVLYHSIYSLFTFFSLAGGDACLHSHTLWMMLTVNHVDKKRVLCVELFNEKRKALSVEFLRFILKALKLKQISLNFFITELHKHFYFMFNRFKSFKFYTIQCKRLKIFISPSYSSFSS